MNVSDIIYKKREGKNLSEKEISFLIKNYVNDEIPDYQMAAWAMAVFFQGMNDREMKNLTIAMAQSGEQLNLNCISGFTVDKHSTGGVGDTTSLILLPLIASTGIPVVKMSGKGLGHTGGTIDKLQSIPGFKTEFKKSELITKVKNIGAALSGQTGNLAPADKKLYSLRDVTATVDSIPLIASSIMSKKIAGGARGIILDVKVGKGAFMKKISEAQKLAKAMVSIGSMVNRKMGAVISDMNQPLGRAVGNSLEVKEAIQTLKGKGPDDLVKLSLALGARMLMLTNNYNDYDYAYRILKEKIKSGLALDKFSQFIKSQGGKEKIIDNFSLLPQAEYLIEVKSKKTGYIQELNPRKIGLTAMRIGAGRKTKKDTIDPAAGIKLNKKYGNKVEKNELLATLHINNKELKDKAVNSIYNSFKIGENKPAKRNLIYDYFTGEI